MPVAFSHTGVAAFVAAGADHAGGLGFDQLLQRPAGKFADQIDAIAGLQRSQQIGQGRLRQSHRCVLLRWVLTEHTKDHADGSPTGGPRIPTTPRGSVLPISE